MSDRPSVPIDEARNAIRDNEFQFLNRQDQEILETASRNVIGRLLQDYPDKLPDAFIFPDTSARPLVSLVRPVLDKVAQQRGVPKPQYYFFPPVRTRGGTESYERAIEGYDSKEEAIKGLKVRLEKLQKGDTSMEPAWNLDFGVEDSVLGIEQDLAYLTDDVFQAQRDSIEKLRDSMKEKAERIKYELEKNTPSPSVVIFDDYIDLMETIFDLRSTFSRIGISNLPAYVLVGTKRAEYDALDIRVGIEFEERPEEIGLTSKKGFHYRKTEGIGVKKKLNEQGGAEVVRFGNSAEIKTLRQDMTLIGNRVAASLSS